jgi:hypothetical protein
MQTEKTEADLRLEARELTAKVRYHGAAYSGDPKVDRARMRLECARDLAILLGGESLETFVHCTARIVESYEIVGTDSCPFSLLFSGKGLFGGMIFHTSCREWSLHT